MRENLETYFNGNEAPSSSAFEHSHISSIPQKLSEPAGIEVVEALPQNQQNIYAVQTTEVSSDPDDEQLLKLIVAGFKVQGYSDLKLEQDFRMERYKYSWKWRFADETDILRWAKNLKTIKFQAGANFTDLATDLVAIIDRTAEILMGGERLTTPMIFVLLIRAFPIEHFKIRNPAVSNAQNVDATRDANLLLMSKVESFPGSAVDTEFVYNENVIDGAPNSEPVLVENETKFKINLQSGEEIENCDRNVSITDAEVNQVGDELDRCQMNLLKPDPCLEELINQESPNFKNFEKIYLEISDKNSHIDNTFQKIYDLVCKNYTKYCGLVASTKDILNQAKVFRATNFPETDSLAISEILGMLDRANEILTRQRLSPYQILILLITVQNSRHICSIPSNKEKSMTIACLAIIKFLQGETHIDLITQSKSAADQAIEECSDLYKAFGVTVAVIPEYAPEGSTYSWRTASVVYGTIRSFQKDYLKYDFKTKEPGQRPYRTVIFDDIDEFLCEGNLYDNFKIPGKSRTSECVKEMLRDIWKNLQPAENSCIRDMAEMLEHGQEEIKLRFEAEVNDMREEKTKSSSSREPRDAASTREQELKEAVVEDAFQNLQKLVREKVQFREHRGPPFVQDFIEASIDRWIKAAIAANYVLKKDEDYTVETRNGSSQAVLLIDNNNNSTNLQKKANWSHVLLQFIELKHGMEMSEPALGPFSISSYGLINLYTSCLWGITNYTSSIYEQRLLQTIYNVQYTVLPSFSTAQPKREEYGGEIIPDENWINQLCRNAEQLALRNGTAVLMICRTIWDCQDVVSCLKYIENNPTDTNLVSEESCFRSIRSFLHEGSETPMLLQPGDVLVATAAAARLLKLQPSPEAVKNGGIHIILSYFPGTERQRAQALSHISNKGGGSYQYIVRTSEVEALLSIEAENQLLKETSGHIVKDSEGEEWKDLTEDEELDEIGFFKSLHYTLTEIERLRIERIRKFEFCRHTFVDGIFEQFANYFRTIKQKRSKNQELSAEILQDFWSFWIHQQLQADNWPHLDSLLPGMESNEWPEMGTAILKLSQERFHEFLQHAKDFIGIGDPSLPIADLPFQSCLQWYKEGATLSSEDPVGPGPSPENAREDTDYPHKYNVFSGARNKNVQDPHKNRMELYKTSKFSRLQRRHLLLQNNLPALVGLNFLEQSLEALVRSRLSDLYSTIQSQILEHHLEFVLLKLLNSLTESFLSPLTFQQICKELVDKLYVEMWVDCCKIETRCSTWDWEPPKFLEKANLFRSPCSQFYIFLMNELCSKDFSAPAHLDDVQIQDLLNFTVDLMTAKAYKIVEDNEFYNMETNSLHTFEQQVVEKALPQRSNEYKGHFQSRKLELFIYNCSLDNKATVRNKYAKLEKTIWEMRLFLMQRIMDVVAEGGGLSPFLDTEQLSVFMRTPIFVDGNLIPVREYWGFSPEAKVAPLHFQLRKKNQNAGLLRLIDCSPDDGPTAAEQTQYFVERMKLALSDDSNLHEFLRKTSPADSGGADSEFSDLKSLTLFFLAKQSEARLGEVQEMRAKRAGSLTELLANTSNAGGHTLTKHESVHAGRKYLSKHPEVLNLTTFQGRNSLLEALKKCLRLIRNKKSWLPFGASYEIYVDGSKLDKSYNMVEIRRGAESGLQYRIKKANFFTIVLGYRSEGYMRGRPLHLQSFFPRNKRPVKLKEGMSYLIEPKNKLPRVKPRARPIQNLAIQKQQDPKGSPPDNGSEEQPLTMFPGSEI